MKKIFYMMVAMLFPIVVTADTIDVSVLKYAGPYTVRRPVMFDSLDVSSRRFSAGSLIDTHVDLAKVKGGKEMAVSQLPKKSDDIQLHLAGFNVSNDVYTKADITVKGMKFFQLFFDGKKTDGRNLEFLPAVHEVVVKYVTDTSEQMPIWGISLSSAKDSLLTVMKADDKRSYQLSDVLHAWRFNRASISPDGDYLIAGYSTVQEDGKNAAKTLVKNISTGTVVDQRTGISWMPRTNKYYFVRVLDGKRSLVTVDPLTHEEQTLAEDLPEGGFVIAPTEDYLVFTTMQEAPKEAKDVYQVVEPDDRQPGWRNRSSISIFDIKTGVSSPLIFSNHSFHLNDISEDGTKFLVSKSASRLEKRPTTVSSLYLIDKNTYQVDTLFTDDGFFSSAIFSPDAGSVLLSGSPEAFGGIGNVVPEGRTPSMIDNQLYLMDVGTKRITPLTKSFNPSVQNAVWSRTDGLVYFTAEDKDCINFFRLNPKDGKISRIQVPEELVNRFSLAAKTNSLAFYGQSASNSDRLYVMDTKKLKTTLVEDLSKETLKDIRLGDCVAWNYLNDRGDTICCRYYLPADFNPECKYPMIVNYYGGCSPTSRNFESRYPHHAYAAQGYVVLVINPSGATGFGQEFSSRHVNTAGEGVAEDIIGATKTFCKEHQFVNDKKIGCIGASYGGFMTQYLQTKTDIFAAAISHAGISDHTSYWGEGFWGYSYSEVSMANSYPWTDKHLYVDQSPLFNADKINTPILFLHGTKDNNVPVGESIQMFTALKLLGKDTAMVLVEDQDHHIIDYTKRIKWQNTIFAYFAKYLKDDPSWWNSIYKQPNL